MVVVYAAGRLAIDKRKYKQASKCVEVLAAGWLLDIQLAERDGGRERQPRHPSHTTQQLDSSRFPLAGRQPNG